jgi:uncharacterized protein YbcI
MSASEETQTVAPLAAISNAMVSLHKQQFGRGPTRARTNYAGDDTIVCVMEDALLPAESAMVAMGEGYRVEEGRLWFQNASATHFVTALEAIVGRKVWSFASATDSNHGVVTEIFHLEASPTP